MVILIWFVDVLYHEPNEYDHQSSQWYVEVDSSVYWHDFWIHDLTSILFVRFLVFQ